MYHQRRYEHIEPLSKEISQSCNQSSYTGFIDEWLNHTFGFCLPEIIVDIKHDTHIPTGSGLVVRRSKEIKTRLNVLENLIKLINYLIKAYSWDLG